MRYTLKQLAVFDAIASLGNVSAAADQLALTQSATSMSLSQLEKMLGKPLFERVGRRMVLTYWGQWLRPKARALLADARQIELGFAGQHLVSGEIRVGPARPPPTTWYRNSSVKLIGTFRRCGSPCRWRTRST